MPSTRSAHAQFAMASGMVETHAHTHDTPAYLIAFLRLLQTLGRSFASVSIIITFSYWQRTHLRDHSSFLRCPACIHSRIISPPPNASGLPPAHRWLSARLSRVHWQRPIGCRQAQTQPPAHTIHTCLRRCQSGPVRVGMRCSLDIRCAHSQPLVLPSPVCITEPFDSEECAHSIEKESPTVFAQSNFPS